MHSAQYDADAEALLGAEAADNLFGDVHLLLACGCGLEQMPIVRILCDGYALLAECTDTQVTLLGLHVWRGW